MSYYVLNTNMRTQACFTDEMLKGPKASAYTAPWNKKIDRLCEGDIVFLYKSGAGIVAYGRVCGKPKPADRGPKKEEEHYAPLDSFVELVEPVSAQEIRLLLGKEVVFRPTLFLLKENDGKKLRQEIDENRPKKQTDSKEGTLSSLGGQTPKN